MVNTDNLNIGTDNEEGRNKIPLTNTNNLNVVLDNDAIPLANFEDINIVADNDEESGATPSANSDNLNIVTENIEENCVLKKFPVIEDYNNNITYSLMYSHRTNDQKNKQI